MTLIELFNAVNLAGIRLANVGGRLELRGPTIPCDVKAGALEHKDTILALLPPIPEPTPQPDPDALELADERDSIIAEAEGKLPVEALARVLTEWDTMVAEQSCKRGADPFCPDQTHRLAWRSIHNALVCATCHPPAYADLVRRWEWTPDKEAAEALAEWAESSANKTAILDN